MFVFHLFLTLLQVSLAAGPAKELENDILQYFESLYPPPTPESTFLRAVAEECTAIELYGVSPSPCLFTLSRKEVVQLTYRVRGPKKDTLVHVPIIGPLAKATRKLKCTTPEAECTIRAGYIQLGNDMQVLSVILKSFRPGSGNMIGCAVWEVPPEDGFLYRLP